MKEKIQILLIGANHSQSKIIRITDEIQRLIDGFNTVKYRDSISFMSLPAVKRSDLSKYISYYKPEIVLFSGHGEDGEGPLFTDDTTFFIPKKQIDTINTLKNYSDFIKIIIFNICESKSIATEVSKFIDCVIGTTISVNDNSAIDFSESFFKSFGNGDTIRISYANAIQQYTTLGGNENHYILENKHDITITNLLDTIDTKLVVEKEKKLKIVEYNIVEFIRNLFEFDIEITILNSNFNLLKEYNILTYRISVPNMRVNRPEILNLIITFPKGYKFHLYFCRSYMLDYSKIPIGEYNQSIQFIQDIDHFFLDSYGLNLNLEKQIPILPLSSSIEEGTNTDFIICLKIVNNFSNVINIKELVLFKYRNFGERHIILRFREDIKILVKDEYIFKKEIDSERYKPYYIGIVYTTINQTNEFFIYSKLPEIP